MALREELVSGTRLGQFASVGVAGSIVDLSVAASLALAGLLSPEWAKLVGAECAIVLMFLINDRWTFASHGTNGLRPKLRRLLKSNVVRSAGLAVQFLVVRSLTRLDLELIVGGTDVWTLVTMPIAIACASLVNYLAESLFTWRVQRGV